jgi:hypothetical protein
MPSEIDRDSDEPAHRDCKNSIWQVNETKRKNKAVARVKIGPHDARNSSSIAGLTRRSRQQIGSQSAHQSSRIVGMRNVRQRVVRQRAEAALTARAEWPQAHGLTGPPVQSSVLVQPAKTTGTVPIARRKLCKPQEQARLEGHAEPGSEVHGRVCRETERLCRRVCRPKSEGRLWRQGDGRGNPRNSLAPWQRPRAQSHTTPQRRRRGNQFAIAGEPT